MFKTYSEISDYSVTTFSFGSIRQSLFRLLGTGQFSVSAKDTDSQLNVYLSYRNKYIKSGSVNYVYRYEVDEDGKVDDVKFAQWYLNFVRKNLTGIKKEITKIEKELKRQERIENKYKELEEKYNDLVNTETWYFTYDRAFFATKEDALKDTNLWAFSENKEWNAMRHSFILEISGAEIIRYCHINNTYYTLVPSDLTAKVEATNWYGYGYNNGYNDNYCCTSESEQCPTPDFQCKVAEEVYWRGYSDGSYQGGMDT